MRATAKRVCLCSVQTAARLRAERDAALAAVTARVRVARDEGARARAAAHEYAERAVSSAARPPAAARTAWMALEDDAGGGCWRGTWHSWYANVFLTPPRTRHQLEHANVMMSQT